MEESVIIADDAARGVSDISGGKDGSGGQPETCPVSVPRDADGEQAAEGSTLEAEFDELIKGRFKDVYKRRTENIIRKRLRSGKAHASNENAPVCTPEPSVSKPVIKEKSLTEEVAVSSVRTKNSSRPIENGISGSCGVVTRVNVSALSGSEVISLLKRAEAGERICFK